MHTPEQKAHWMALWRQATAECDTTEAFVTRFAALVVQHERELAAKTCQLESVTLATRDMSRGAQPRKAYVVVGHNGVAWVGFVRDEAEAWQIALGWPHEDEIADAKERGWYAAEATIHWAKPPERKRHHPADQAHPDAAVQALPWRSGQHVLGNCDSSDHGEMTAMHTPEQIEQWTDHANGEMGYADDLTPEWIEFLTRFAALVVQHERETRPKLLAGHLIEAHMVVTRCNSDHIAGTSNWAFAMIRELRKLVAAAIRKSDGG